MGRTPRGPRWGALAATVAIGFLLVPLPALRAVGDTAPSAGPSPGYRGVPIAAGYPGWTGAASPDPGTLLSTVSMLNGSQWPWNRLIPNGIGPRSVVFDSLDHRLYVGVSGPPSGLLVIDPSDRALTGFVDLGLAPGAAPVALAYDALDGRILAANGPADNLSVLNATSQGVVHSTAVPAGSDPVGVAYDPNSDRFYVAERGANVVVAVDPNGSAVGAAIPVGAGPSALAYDPFLDRLIVADSGSDQVTIIDPGQPSNRSTLGVGHDPEAVGYDPATGKVLVVNRLSDNVTVLDPYQLRASSSYRTGSDPSGIAVSTTGYAYIANQGSDNVSVVYDVNGTSLAPVAVGRAPGPAEWAGTLGEIYVTDSLSDNLSVISGSTQKGLGNIRTGVAPSAVADLPWMNGVAVALPDERSLRFVGLPNGTFLGAMSTPAPAVALSSDPTDQRLFVTLDPMVGASNGSVLVVDPRNGSVDGSFPVPGPPSGTVYDPNWRELYVASGPLGLVTVLDPWGNGTLATLPVPASNASGPGAVDAFSLPSPGDLLYLSIGGSNGTLVVINAASESVIGNLSVAPDPGPIAYLWVPHELYVATSVGLTVVDLVAGRDVANLTTQGPVLGVSYDPSKGYVYAASGPSRSAGVEVFDPSSRLRVAVVPYGYCPGSAALDNISGTLAFADPCGGTLGIVGPTPATFTVTFQETGLSQIPAPGWEVQVDGEPFWSTTDLVAVSEPNGTHAFRVAAVPPLYPLPGSGTFTVAGVALPIAIQFGPLAYNVTFVESGLPVGTPWWVDCGSQNRSDTGAEIQFLEPNGSYAFSAGTSALYEGTVASASGTIEVAGAAPPLSVVDFVALPPYLIEFAESGLANGTRWSVNLEALTAYSNRTTIDFRVGSGTFVYTIPPVGGLHATPASGQVTVSGSSPAPIAVRFGSGEGPATFPVTFVPFGLPASSEWSVVLAGTTFRGTGPIVASEPNGSYPFQVPRFGDLGPVPSSGTVVVSGGPVNASIRFGPVTATGGGTPTVLTPTTAGFLAIGAGLALVGVLVWRRLRRSRPIEAELFRAGPAQVDRRRDAPGEDRSPGYVEIDGGPDPGPRPIEGPEEDGSGR